MQKINFWTLVCCLFIARDLSAQAQWQRVEALSGEPVFTLYRAGDTLYAATANHIHTSADGGKSWQVSAPIQAPNDDEVTDFLVADGVWYAATLLNGCRVSTDGGTSWQAHNNGLSGLGSLNLTALAIRGDSLYAATLGAGVFVKPRTPVLAPWERFNQNMPWGNVQSLSVSGAQLLAGAGGNASVSLNTSPEKSWTERPFDVFNGEINLFLGAIREGNVWLGAGTQGLYRSTDEGMSWTRFNPGTGLIEKASFSAYGEKTIALLSKPNGSFLRITENQGLSWNNFQPAMPGGGLGFDLLEYAGSLFCARSDGLWVLAPTVPAIEAPEPAGSNVEALFPNPAAPTQTTVSFVLQHTVDNLRIGLTDARGRVVREIQLGRLVTGRYREPLSLQGLAPGVYLCTLYGAGLAPQCRTLLISTY